MPSMPCCLGARGWRTEGMKWVLDTQRTANLAQANPVLTSDMHTTDTVYYNQVALV